MTATSGIFDSSSKSLGVAMLDDDQDGWPDLIVANDTQPNKLYRNLRNGTFKEVGVQAGVAFSADGRARAGMGIDAGRLRQLGPDGRGRHELRQRDGRALSPARPGPLRGRGDARGRRRRVAQPARVRLPVRRSRSGWRARSRRGERPHRRGRAKPPQRCRAMPSRRSSFRTWATASFRTSPPPPAPSSPARGSAAASPAATSIATATSTCSMTTNNGPAVLFRNDQLAGNRSIRFRLVGTKSNRDAIGARVRVFHDGVDAVAHGEDRFQLSVAVGAAGDVRRRQARPRRSRRHRLAERPDRGVQGRACGQGLRVCGGERDVRSSQSLRRERSEARMPEAGYPPLIAPRLGGSAVRGLAQ